MLKHKNKSELFETACIEVRKRDYLNRVEFKLLGKGREKVVTLKGPYSIIASKYLYFEPKGNSKVFSWQQITDACIIANLYVTDVISKQL